MNYWKDPEMKDAVGMPPLDSPSTARIGGNQRTQFAIKALDQSLNDVHNVFLAIQVNVNVHAIFTIFR